MTEKHTPTPWSVTEHEFICAGIDYIADLNYSELPKEERHANAEFIVKAVNSHEALVAALMKCSTELPRMLEYAERDADVAALVDAIDTVNEALGMVNPAIAELNAKVKDSRARAALKLAAGSEGK